MDKREYKPLTTPLLSWNETTLNKNYGELIAQPLAPGFGVTLGNALRRALLGGVEGTAVTSLIIKGVNNEFSSLPGVVEDVMQIVLNIKRLVLHSSNGQSGTMSLSVQKEGTVYAKDIIPSESLQIINQNHVIATVAPGGSLEITFFVENGRGYQLSQWPEQQLQSDDRMYIDAMFSCVTNVSFDVEKTRVGDNIDYDKLILRIQTNEAQTPSEVLHYAVSLLRTQLEYFLSIPEIPFNDYNALNTDHSSYHQSEKLSPQSSQAELKSNMIELLAKPIEELELSVRAHNCLLTAGIIRIVQLVNLSENDVLHIKNFGRKSLNEVKDSLALFGLSLGMNINEDTIPFTPQNDENLFEDDEDEFNQE